jgi:membrane peptidoglycan carboxypeptidase
LAQNDKNYKRVSLNPIKWLAVLRNELTRIDQHVRLSSHKACLSLTALELMIIVLEDRRFFRHCGVDVLSIVREMYRALTLQRHGGASTIEMQFVRTATGFRQHTIWRKLCETLLAIIVSRRYHKIVILRSYVACAFFGSGLVGADAAARKVFGREASRLTLEEAALIAAMLARPRPLGGSASWEARARRRAAYGLRVYGSSNRRLTIPFDIILNA